MALLTFILVVFSLIFITGACIGSFLNVVVLRGLSGESINFPGSKCPKCQKPLKWYHNIPILSYIFLKGKCAFCNEKISIQYPIVELITGTLFLFFFIKCGVCWYYLFLMFFLSMFIVLAVCDIREKVILDVHAYILVVGGLIFNFFNIGHLYFGEKIFNIGSISFAINNSFFASILGIILGIIIMEAFARSGYLLAGTRAFGEGDSYIAAALGAIFGWKYLITVLLYSFIIQVVLTIPVFVKKLFVNKDYKTIITFLIFGFWVWLIKIFQYNYIIFLILTLFLCAIGLYLCVRILRGIKDNQENMTYLPFGPAMVLGATFVFFLL